MRTYATHGSGKTVKILSVSDHEPARTVTSCPAEQAAAVTRALTHTDRELPAALYPVARDLDGKPAQARRHLLGVYDTVAAGTTRQPTSPAWAPAEQVVTALGASVAALPDPVIAAVRAELADQLTGFDGVLVPACLSTGWGKREALFLVISGPLHWLGEQFWDELLDPDLVGLNVCDDDRTFPLGGPVVTSSAFWELLAELHHVEPGPDVLFGPTVAELRTGNEDDELDLTVRVDHLVAFVTQHRPDRLEQLTAQLAG